MNIIFGDSFIGPFTLLINDKLYIKKFKGKTMKGISKNDTKDNNLLINTIKNIKNNKGINNVIFMFGQVDILFSIYYEILIKKNYNIQDYLNNIHKEYCNFLINIDDILNNKKVILSICPLMLSDEEAFHSLYLYDIINQDILNNIPMNLKNIIFSYNFRNSCRIYLNKLNEKFCKKHFMKFINFDTILIDKNTNKPLNELKVIESPYNIHPYFEVIILKYLSKLKFLNINSTFKDNLNNSKNEYKDIKKELSKEKFDNINFINYDNNIYDDNLNNIIDNLNNQIINMNNI